MSNNELTIKKVLINAANILVIDSDNKIWIMGNNKYRKTGYGFKNKSIYSPICTNIILEITEDIKLFYCYDYMMIIYTTLGKLYISNNLANMNEKLNENRSDNFNRVRDVNDTPIDTPELIRRSFMRNREISPMAEEIILDITYTPNINHYRYLSNDHDEYPNQHQDEYVIEEILDQTPNHSLSNLVGSSVREQERAFLINDNGRDNGRDNERDNESENDSNSDSDMSINEDLEEIIELNGCIDEDVEIISNNKYFKKIEKKLFGNIDIICKGFTLLEDKIEEIMALSNFVIFKKNNNLYFFDCTTNSYETILHKELDISVLAIDRGFYNYSQLMFPFDISNAIFCDRFVYLYVNGYHHILMGNDRLIECRIVWLYFKTDLEINHANIFINSDEPTIYVKKDQTIYKYYHYIHQLKPYVTDFIKCDFVITNDQFHSMMFVFKKDGFYLDESNLTKYVDYHPLFDYFIDINTYANSNLILIKTDSPMRYKIDDRNLYLNVNEFLYYKLVDNGIIYYDASKTLFYCTNLELPSHQYNTMEVEKIILESDTYYIYIFTGVPNPVDNITFTNNLILIKSNENFYYHTINTEKFVVENFTVITIQSELETKTLVIKDHVIRQKKRFESSTELYISINTNKFRKLLNIMELFRNRTDFDIKYINKNNIVSYGDGPKREFMESAINEFFEKYLIKHNILTTFNLEKISEFLEDELISIGYMLHAVICHSCNPLPFKLPLILLETVKKKPIKLEELEYFAKIEDPELFNNAFKFRNNLEAFKSLDAGYDSYYDLICDVCKYQTNLDKNISEICKNIGIGFKSYMEIKNLNIMNYPTLDYYISGDPLIDRRLLIKNLEVNSIDSETNYTDIVVNIIKNLSEDKLIILLRNWSGTSIVKKNVLYRVDIMKSKHMVNQDIHYATCSLTMNISEEIIKTYGSSNLLIDVLSSPMTSMIDP